MANGNQSISEIIGQDPGLFGGGGGNILTGILSTILRAVLPGADFFQGALGEILSGFAVGESNQMARDLGEAMMGRVEDLDLMSLARPANFDALMNQAFGGEFGGPGGAAQAAALESLQEHPIEELDLAGLRNDLLGLHGGSLGMLGGTAGDIIGMGGRLEDRFEDIFSSERAQEFLEGGKFGRGEILGDLVTDFRAAAPEFSPSAALEKVGAAGQRFQNLLGQQLGASEEGMAFRAGREAEAGEHFGRLGLTAAEQAKHGNLAVEQTALDVGSRGRALESQFNTALTQAQAANEQFQQAGLAQSLGNIYNTLVPGLVNIAGAGVGANTALGSQLLGTEQLGAINNATALQLADFLSTLAGGAAGDPLLELELMQNQGQLDLTAAMTEIMAMLQTAGIIPGVNIPDPAGFMQSMMNASLGRSRSV